MKLIDSLVSQADFFTTIRRDLHAHPELFFEEFRTAEIVANTLEQWGIEVYRKIGKTGVVGVLRSGNGGRSIGLRADMDALPVTENNTFAHHSVYPGKMHACGHDGHTAMLLAGAWYLSQHRQFNGTVNFIFQPAEECGGGAEAMMADGLFERFPCEAIFALHNWPGFKVGEFAVKSGPIMGSITTFEIQVIGKSVHAAMPHLGIDPVLVASHIVTALQSLVSRSLDPLDTAVVSVTRINAGEVVNVIPDQATMHGTIRAFKTNVVEDIEAGVRRIADHVAHAFGATTNITFEYGYPPTVNDPEQSAFAATVLDDIVGEENVLRVHEASMAGEDFSYMLQKVPGAYIWIGNGDGSHRLAGHGIGNCMLHNSSYDFNDQLLCLGGSFWARLVERFLTA
ncbi:MAG: M20 aminoacylase family protein [Pseudomonadota bacterium]